MLSAGVIKEGGAAAQICKMCFGNKLGFKFDHELTPQELYAPLSGSLILEMADHDEADGSSITIWELPPRSLWLIQYPQNLI